MTKHEGLLKELKEELFLSTKEFLEEEEKKDNDFEKVLDAERKYKKAYREVQDKKIKINDVRN